MTAPANSVRIVWTSSMLVDAKAPTGGISIPELSAPTSDQNRTTQCRKRGTGFWRPSLRRRLAGTDCQPHAESGESEDEDLDKAPKIAQILTSPVLHNAKLGAYTGLWTGLSEEVTIADGGRYVVPWDGGIHSRGRIL